MFAKAKVPVHGVMQSYNWYVPYHKHIRNEANRFARGLGRIDFQELKPVLQIAKQYQELRELIAVQAHHEDSYYTPLLASKDRHLEDKVRKDHFEINLSFENLQSRLALLRETRNGVRRAEQAQDLYHHVLSFNARLENHFQFEETIVMTSLRERYGIQNLRRAVTFRYLEHLSVEKLLLSVEEFFPLLNFTEKAIILLDIADGDSYAREFNPTHTNKFPAVHRLILEQKLLSLEEQERFRREYFMDFKYVRMPIPIPYRPM